MEKKVDKILKELKEELNIEEDIKLFIKDYKRKLGSASIDKKHIRINRKIVNDEKLLRKVLYHELLHIKNNSKWHTIVFFEI